MLFPILGIAILFAFYFIYIGKMIAQKKKGIQTNQIAKGKANSKLFATELIMKIATYSVVVVEIISIIYTKNSLSIWVRIVGLIAAIVGVFIFGLSVFTMKDSWRAGIAENDKTEMVTSGIYSYSRNPAFLGFDLVYLGIFLMFFNWLLLLFSLFAMIMLHLQILQEEKFLPSIFGETYLRYKNQVRRYLGRKEGKNTQ